MFAVIYHPDMDTWGRGPLHFYCLNGFLGNFLHACARTHKGQSRELREMKRGTDKEMANGLTRKASFKKSAILSQACDRLLVQSRVVQCLNGRNWFTGDVKESESKIQGKLDDGDYKPISDNQHAKRGLFIEARALQTIAPRVRVASD